MRMGRVHAPLGVLGYTTARNLNPPRRVESTPTCESSVLTIGRLSTGASSASPVK